MRRGAHLSDDRIVEVCVDRLTTPAEEAHLAQCDACTGRRSRLERLFHDMFDAVVAEADAAFPQERLATQHARILQRIELQGRPARVLAFPASELPDLRTLRARPAARWIAGAAAAGLAIGLLLGHLAHDLPTFGRPPRPAVSGATALRPVNQPTLRVVNTALNDEEFLGEIENAVSGPHLIALRPLNDLTPQ
jgi:anti-sigma factor RsiW